jgi:DNA modification methylase
MKYKEGFSRGLVERFIEHYRPKSVLDPFAGIGTTPLIAGSKGIQATGIEIMPVGVLVGKAITHAANGVSKSAFEAAGRDLIGSLSTNEHPSAEFAFPHVKITKAAFSEETEIAIAKARQFVSSVDGYALQTLLNVACMTVLEDVSYTRKDGQYLRWDYRSGRSLRARMHKGPIPTFERALEARLFEMTQDIETLKREYGGSSPNLVIGSCLNLLQGFEDSSIDMAITSPPYANRYDYTRTYALELAWLGFDQNDFVELRQNMLSATVENKTKLLWLRQEYGSNPSLLDGAVGMFQNQSAIQEVISILNENVSELSNRHVIRLLEGYFQEMAIVVAELGRLIRSGGTVIMVNDNVQYHGEEVPVDLILADFAEQSGFECQQIWMLPRGKGNSSQQMGRFGRREIRKCVYRWVRK